MFFQPNTGGSRSHLRSSPDFTRDLMQKFPEPAATGEFGWSPTVFEFVNISIVIFFPLYWFSIWAICSICILAVAACVANDYL